jgi:molecular chaperone HscB
MNLKDKNYFEIFDLPVAIQIDEKALTKAYYRLSMQYHPDRYTLKSAEEQKEAINNTAIINEAYKVIKDRQSRIKNILQLSGVTLEEGKERVPQDFLMEMMDINEEIMEYKMEPSEKGLQSLIGQLEKLESKIFEQISHFITTFKADNIDQQSLLALKDYFLKNQYINNIKRNLNG